MGGLGCGTEDSESSSDNAVDPLAQVCFQGLAVRDARTTARAQSYPEIFALCDSERASL